MKTVEELNAIKSDLEAVRSKLEGLSDEELVEVSGGWLPLWPIEPSEVSKDELAKLVKFARSAPEELVKLVKLVRSAPEKFILDAEETKVVF